MGIFVIEKNMARKPRIHFPGAVYHVIIRGNGGQDIFFAKQDRTKFYLLLQQGVEKFEHRILAFCLMSNHVHLVIQVAEHPLSRIMQNVSFRYTRYINARKKRIGHLFQGRYKAILVDVDHYLLELVRYIHNNPVRADLAKVADHYAWSSHHTYSGKESIPWLAVEPVLARFSRDEKRARALYRDFILHGSDEGHREEFHRGTHEGRILGDDRFSEDALHNAEEVFNQAVDLRQIISATGRAYGVKGKELAEAGKARPASEARAIAALLVQNCDSLTLTALGQHLGRDLSSLSQAANRLRRRLKKDSGLRKKVAGIRKSIHQQ